MTLEVNDFIFPQVYNDISYMPFTFNEHKKQNITQINNNISVELYDEQKIVLDEIFTKLNTKGPSIFLNLYTGFGKTLTTIYFIAATNKSAIVIVPTKLIKNQWINEIKKFSKLNIKIFCPISLRNMLNKNTNIKADIVVVDECHMISKLIYTDLLLRLKYDILIGLSATPRNDELYRLFFYSKIIRFQKKQIKVYYIRLKFKPEVTYKWQNAGYYNGQWIPGQYVLDYFAVLKSLTDNEERLNYISKIIIEIVKLLKEKAVIIVKNVKTVKQLALKLNKFKVSTLYGKITNLDYIDSDILIGTDKKIGVGFDIDKSFKILFICDNILNVSQEEGRIRLSDFTLIDFIDDHSAFEYHWSERRKWYTERGSVIKELIL